MKNTTTRRAADAMNVVSDELSKLAENPRPCIVCGTKKVGFVGMRLVESDIERDRFGAPQGKDRVFLYCACRKHAPVGTKPDQERMRLLKEIDAAILRGMRPEDFRDGKIQLLS